MPAECDVSIRPGWFWHASENDKVKPPEKLFDLYLKSVGRGASFLLNVPPDRRGLIHENDAASLREFGKRVRDTFGRNVAAGINPIMRNSDVILDLGAVRRFVYVQLREDIALGQRVGAFAVDIWKDGMWTEAGKGTSIGLCRILQLPQAVATPRVRLRILKTEATPRIAEFGLYTDAADSPV
jgi:alpha-L-fucosidase